MSIFDIFKSKANAKTISLEKQLDTLSKLGIKPVHGDFLDWLCTEWSKDAIESDPYNLMLFSLGGERERGNSWEYLSDDIFYFDTECVEEEDIYETVIKRLEILSKDAFQAVDLHSIADIERQTAFVSFSFSNVQCRWNLEFNDDWFDVRVISYINYLLHASGSQSYFYTCVPDQGITVVFTNKETIAELNLLVETQFILEKSEPPAL